MAGCRSCQSDRADDLVAHARASSDVRTESVGPMSVAKGNSQLMQVLDKLNQRYGRGMVKVSTQGSFKGW